MTKFVPYTGPVKATMQDVKDAQSGYDDHMQEHKCRIGDGCVGRLAAWKEIGRVAAMWNEPA